MEQTTALGRNAGVEAADSPRFSKYPTSDTAIDTTTERQTLHKHLNEIAGLSLSICASATLLSLLDSLTGNYIERTFQLNFSRYAVFDLVIWGSSYLVHVGIWSFFVFWRRFTFDRGMLRFFSRPWSSAGFVQYSVFMRWSEYSWVVLAVLRYSDVSAANGQGFVINEWRVRVVEQLTTKLECAAWALLVQAVLGLLVFNVAGLVRRLRIHWSVGIVSPILFCVYTIPKHAGAMLPPPVADPGVVLDPTCFRMFFVWELFCIGELADPVTPLASKRLVLAAAAALMPDQWLIPLAGCVAMATGWIAREWNSRDYRVHWLCSCGYESFDDLYNVPGLQRLPEVLVTQGTVESARIGVDGPLYSSLQYEVEPWRLMIRDFRRLFGVVFTGAWRHPRVGVDGMMGDCAMVGRGSGERTVFHLMVSRA